MKWKKDTGIPTRGQLEAELKREIYRRRFAKMVRGTISTLIVVAAICVLVAFTLFPVLRIYGTSMSPTLSGGNVVLSWRTDSFERGDVIAFYYNNNILVKRVIGLPGDWVDIDKDGNVYINGTILEEPYLKGKALGESDIEFPYQVPEGRYFVMGDNRSVSSDSRSSEIGCVAVEQVLGKLLLRIWPLNEIEIIG
jgi:signal peptidase I